MSLVKKILFTTFLILSLALGIWAYNALQQNKKPSTDALAVMPDSCLVYIAAKNFNELSIKLNSQSLIFDKWKAFSDIKKLSDNIQFYDSLIYSNDLLKEILDHNTIHLAVYHISGKTNWLAAFNVKELKQEVSLMELCTNYFKTANAAEYQISNNCYASIKRGVVLLSDNKELISKGFESGNKLKDNTSFIKQLSSVGNNDMMLVYLNHELYKQVSPTQFKLNSLLEAGESVASLKLSPDEIIWNGSYSPDTTLLQRVIESQEPVPMLFYDLLPFGTKWFKSIGISNSKVFQNTIQTNSTCLNYWESIDAKAMYKVSNDFYNCVNDVLVCFNSFQNQSAFVTINDTVIITEVLQHIAKADSAFNEVPIYAINQTNTFNSLFDNLIDLKATHAFVMNNALYFTSSYNNAKEIIYAISNNSTLKSNSGFSDYAAQNLNNACNYIYYLSPQACIENVSDFVSYDFKKNKESLENLTDANVSITHQKGNFKFRMQLKYQTPSSGNTPNLLWQCKLDSNAIQQPYLFTNHITKQNEIAIQDNSNQLYLINSTGKVLWKKKINETIRSSIFTVDIFKNGKYQLFFNTDNYLHLIDRNGKDVQGYPIRLPSPASNAVSLIDYDGDNDIRVFIACKNKLIYNFNLYGVKSEGYKPYRTESLVKLPIKFARVGQSDYLITIDESGVIHAFSRKGDGRIGFKNKAIEQCQDFALVTTNNISSTFLYYVDETNNLVSKISFFDKKDVIKLNASLADAKIKFENINNDPTPDFTAQTKNGLYAFDINGVQLYNNPKINIQATTDVESFNSKTWYYTFDPSNRNIIISDNSGGAVQTLKSNSYAAVYDLYKNNKRYMLYYGDGKLTCNLLK